KFSRPQLELLACRANKKLAISNSGNNRTRIAHSPFAFLCRNQAHFKELIAYKRSQMGKRLGLRSGVNANKRWLEMIEVHAGQGLIQVEFTGLTIQPFPAPIED